MTSLDFPEDQHGKFEIYASKSSMWNFVNSLKLNLDQLFWGYYATKKISWNYIKYFFTYAY